MESTHSIADRHGVRYRLEFIIEGRLWSVYAWRNNIQAGHAYCVEEAPALKINDLFIREVMPLPESRWVRIWRRLTGQLTPTYPNRGRGLGSTLLDFIATQAKARGFTLLKGDICTKDYEANPKLPEWYRQRGFTITWHPPGTRRIASVAREL